MILSDNLCLRFKPQIKSWNEMRRHMMVMACMLCLCYKSQRYRLYLNNNKFYGKGWGGSEPSVPTCPLRLRPRNKRHFKTKIVWHLPSLVSPKVFLLYLHTLFVISNTVKLLMRCSIVFERNYMFADVILWCNCTWMLIVWCGSKYSHDVEITIYQLFHCDVDEAWIIW